MPNLSSISSFNLFHNAGFWALLIIFGIETRLQGPLSNKFASHEVDQMIHTLNHESFNATVLFQGDSVAENVFRIFNGKPNRFAMLASNQAIETTGQFFVLRRYLDRNPPPGVLVFMSGLPFYGDLSQVFTENFVQRVFMQWREIAWMSAHKLDPAFALKCLAYKCSPSFRYRLQLQEKILKAPQVDIYSGINLQKVISKEKRPYSLTSLLAKKGQKLRYRNASERSWQRILALCREKNILVYFYPSPTTVSGKKQTQHALKDVREQSQGWPGVFIQENAALTFPDDHFYDGTHLNAKGYQAIRPFQDQWAETLLRISMEQELARKTDTRETMYTLDLREKLHQPPLYTFEGFYQREGYRNAAFRWTQPTFQIIIPPANPLDHLVVETSSLSPATTLVLQVNSQPPKTLTLQAGRQQLEIEIPSPGNNPQPVRLNFKVKGWIPGNGDNRELGIALKSLTGLSLK